MYRGVVGPEILVVALAVWVFSVRPTKGEIQGVLITSVT